MYTDFEVKNPSETSAVSELEIVVAELVRARGFLKSHDFSYPRF